MILPHPILLQQLQPLPEFLLSIKVLRRSPSTGTSSQSNHHKSKDYGSAKKIKIVWNGNLATIRRLKLFQSG
jgi:hypothetical protein